MPRTRSEQFPSQYTKFIDKAQELGSLSHTCGSPEEARQLGRELSFLLPILRKEGRDDLVGWGVKVQGWIVTVRRKDDAPVARGLDATLEKVDAGVRVGTLEDPAFLKELARLNAMRDSGELDEGEKK